MPDTPTLYLFTGDPRAPIPDGFELAPVEATINGDPHKALHVWTGEHSPDLFNWQEWTGETRPVSA